MCECPCHADSDDCCDCHPDEDFFTCSLGYANVYTVCTCSNPDHHPVLNSYAGTGSLVYALTAIKRRLHPD